jgi:hypothetical protein
MSSKKCICLLSIVFFTNILSVSVGLTITKWVLSYFLMSCAPKQGELPKVLLKTKLGTGGTVQDTSLEIQGDHRDALMVELGKIGYTAKRSGG